MQVRRVSSWPARCLSPPTWREEAVEVSDNRPEGGPVGGLVVHAAVNQIGQLGPLGSRQLVPVLIEQVLLQNTRTRVRTCLLSNGVRYAQKP